jgi:DeoR/GlpR family transcriptional regulator of sugar metabolism
MTQNAGTGDVKKIRSAATGDPDEIRMPRGLYIRRKINSEHHVKRQIAAYIAEHYVTDFDAVLLDAGSTAEMIAEELFARRKFLSMLTNNMGAYAAYTRARELATEDTSHSDLPNHGNELLITGGRYVDVYESLLGEGALNSIQKFHPNVIIIGTSGLKCDEGVYCHGSEEAAVKKLLFEIPTDIRLIATDWTKVGKRDAYSFGPVQALTLLAQKAIVVTSEPPEEAYAQQPERVKEFETELKKMQEYNIKVEKVPLN